MADEIAHYKFDVYEKENEDIKMIKLPNIEEILTNQKYAFSPKSLPLI